jgi:hypothetical protein
MYALAYCVGRIRVSVVSRIYEVLFHNMIRVEMTSLASQECRTKSVRIMLGSLNEILISGELEMCLHGIA